MNFVSILNLFKSRSGKIKSIKNHYGQHLWCKTLGVSECLICLGKEQLLPIIRDSYAYMGVTKYSPCYIELYRTIIIRIPFDMEHAITLSHHNPKTSIYLREAIKMDYPSSFDKFDKFLLLA